MKSIEDKIKQNIYAMLPEYRKELLDFTFTLLEKQERETKDHSVKDQSDFNQELLAQIREERQAQKTEQDHLREMWQVRSSPSESQ